MWSIILKSLYFFLPAYIANMAPVLFKWLPWKKIPVSEKYFGRNKSWNGILIATIIGTIIFWLQKLAYSKGFTSLALIDYTDFSIVLGVLMGLGAMVGDLVESYYKRERGIKPGQPWILWDQLDFVIGALVFVFFIYIPSIEALLTILIVSPLLHFVVNYIGYLLGIRKRKV